MNIKYDTSMIYVADMPKIKEVMKEIKKTYSDYDFAHYAYDTFSEIYQNITGEQYPYTGDILRCTLEAFARDFDGVHFRVKIINMTYKEVNEISFYATWHDENGMKFDKETRWNQFKFRYEYTFNVIKYKAEGEGFTILTTEGVQEAV